MSQLVKKEIRLLAPACLVASLLALVQAITRPDDFNIVALMFFGLTIMSLAVFGRESSLNLFSGMLAQPAERLRIWQTKLTVLVSGFLLVFGIWFVAYLIACLHFTMAVDNTQTDDFYFLLVALCLIGISMFTGGLWTTLLVRQVAGAFWLSILAPAILAGLTEVLLAICHLDEFMLPALCVAIGVYSIAGFCFARWLFFRAQDIGWTGGDITFPDWKIFSSATSNPAAQRKRKPLFGLVKKEFQLHRASLVGGVILLVLHIAIISLRLLHHFPKDSPGEILAAIFWMLWLILPVIAGSMAIAEERRFGMMETQLTLPVSPRLHFAIKCSVALVLGTLLGGVIPMTLERISLVISGRNLIFLNDTNFGDGGFSTFQMTIIGLSIWISLISFFGSSLAKNFLQAIGCAIVSCIACTTFLFNSGQGHLLFLSATRGEYVLSLIIGVPTLLLVLLWLAYRNYTDFRNGWPLWRRNILVFLGAALFIISTTAAVYNRAWEIFEPIEPAHGQPTLSLANPPQIHRFGDTVHVQLPDGQVWVDCLSDPNQDPYNSLGRLFSSPLPKSMGAEQFLVGSNWRTLLTASDYYTSLRGYQYVSVGIQQDGTLWIVTNSIVNANAQGQVRVGNASNWQQLASSPAGILLLKSDGTLWRYKSYQDPYYWLGLPTNQLVQVTPASEWVDLNRKWPGLAQKSDGTIWMVSVTRDKNIEQQKLEQLPDSSLEASTTYGDGQAVYCKDGQIFVSVNRNGTNFVLQPSTDTNWLAAVRSDRALTALRSDGTLWRWDLPDYTALHAVDSIPRRLGIHGDWVALSEVSNSALALAADGTLWLWPDQSYYWHGPYGPLLRLPKQPQKIANIFDAPKPL